ncbi:hypothetical protein [Roseateles depolymerans]|uniref:Uncharacterized protein n=1 Tax=Roseateles depolymerans TaxID=76731 RepID=A0A0U3CZ74_9BURK|nr:hypothetical protein [Roseateles depolymerans]ALV06662.1 hypothetical protein RD2015_2190 [Roseateles depolymerans]REG19639.1 hypothetical protein DES44_2139 [Roseateles depolymerans]
MSDRELLKVAALAIEEHAAWVERNEARAALRRKLKAADVDRFPLTESDWDPDEWAEWQVLLGAASKAQAKLGVRRVATRRAITRGVICAKPETKAQAVPEGWKLVPVEPTEAMGIAGGIALEASSAHDIIGPLIDAWSAMLAAAPQPATSEQRKPLTDEQLQELKAKHLWKPYVAQEWVEETDSRPGYYKEVQRGYDDFIGFARAIEAAHGIRSTGGEHE